MSLRNIFWSDVYLMVFTPTLTLSLKREGMKNLAFNPSLPPGAWLLPLQRLYNHGLPLAGARGKARMGVETLTSHPK